MDFYKTVEGSEFEEFSTMFLLFHEPAENLPEEGHWRGTLERDTGEGHWRGTLQLSSGDSRIMFIFGHFVHSMNQGNISHFCKC